VKVCEVRRANGTEMTKVHIL